jgi:hypothetical protein
MVHKDTTVRLPMENARAKLILEVTFAKNVLLDIMDSLNANVSFSLNLIFFN